MVIIRKLISMTFVTQYTSIYSIYMIIVNKNKTDILNV